MPDRRGRRRVLRLGLAFLGLAAIGVVGAWLRQREPRQPAPPPDWRPRADEVSAAGCVAAEPPNVDAGVGRVRFAAIGDFGYAGPTEEAVADLVKGYRPDFIITLGDNNYPTGSAETIDLNIGLFYHEYIAPYVGRFGCGAIHNHFFPALGNHDWMATGARPYLDYFELPGNERYYEIMSGPVQLFALDSDSSEPDGNTAESAQAGWLHQALAVSTAAWKIVYLHHAPYSSGPHGGTTALRWPYRAWGADLVLAGHDHTYERFEVDGLPYVVNGLGGAVFYPLGRPGAGSVARFNQSAGALFVEADETSLHMRFQTIDGRKIDELALAKAPR